jgi:hypothetical protein
MILVRNLLQQLNGNKLLVFSLTLTLFVSCASIFVSPSNYTKIEETKNDSKASSKKQEALEPIQFLDKVIHAPVQRDEKIKIAILLPFNIGKSAAYASIRETVLEYYEGFELALEELSKEGSEIEVEVYDTKSDSSEVAYILTKPFLKNCNIIIGPIFDHEISQVENFCSVYNIQYVNPLRNYNKKTRTSIPVFNPIAADSNKHYFAALKLIELYPKHQFILVNDNTPQGFTARKGYQKAFSDANISLKYLSPDELKTSVTSNVETTVIAPVSSELNVRKVLNVGAGKKDIQILGLEEWFDFPIIPFDLWNKNNLLFFNNYQLETENLEKIQFEQNYQNKYNTNAGKYAYIGYDQARFFIGALCTFGVESYTYIQNKNFPMIHNNFNFRNMGNNVFENSSVNLLKLIDFELVKIK